MCSIGGFLAQHPLDADTAFRLTRALLYYGQARGNQSAGVCQDGAIYKRATDVPTFLADPLFKARPCRWTLTHTRHPTSGGLGDPQAQPFQANKTATVHNGGYWNTTEVKKHFGILKPSGVDSELVTSFVDSYGAQKLGRFLELAEGFSAIATMSRGQLWLARAGNPLHVGFLCLGANRVAVFGSTQFQVEISARHTWLLPDEWESEKLADDTLYTLTPKAVTMREEFNPAAMQYAPLYAKARTPKDADSTLGDVECFGCGASVALKDAEFWEHEFWCPTCTRLDKATGTDALHGVDEWNGNK